MAGIVRANGLAVKEGHGEERVLGGHRSPPRLRSGSRTLDDRQPLGIGLTLRLFPALLALGGGTGGQVRMLGKMAPLNAAGRSLSVVSASGAAGV